MEAGPGAIGAPPAETADPAATDAPEPRGTGADVEAAGTEPAPPPRPVGPVRGHADGFLGSYVTGWATAANADSSCRITVHAPDGTVLGSGLASRRRPDLAVLGGRIDIGFRVLVPDLAGATSLHVRADGAVLANSPLAVGPDRFDGHLSIHGDVASGWVRARTPEPVSPRVTLHAEDGSEVGQAVAGYAVDEGDPHSSRAEFRIEIADAMFGIGEFTLFARADGRPFASALGSLPVEGYLDVLDENHCAGWLISPAAPQRQLRLEILRDGAVAGRGRCQVDRQDLREPYPVGWRNGFSIALEPPREPAAEAAAGRLRTISIRARDGRVELLGGPHLFGDRFTFLSVARGLSRLAHAPAADAGAAALSAAERAVLQELLRRHLDERRHGPQAAAIPAFSTGTRSADRGVDVLIPIYKGIDVTETCIRSALAAVRPGDRLILVADCPPEAAMPGMLDRFRVRDDVVLLHNDTNRGFVASVNRGLNYSRGRDVLLLNSDTRLFPGGLDEMRRVLHGADDVGTVTALSNNATIFSYPHPALATERLDDIPWDAVARIALESGRGRTVDVPTGHGFCMLIRRELLDRVGGLNSTFGRGYGEENELCLRATDLGFRHVAALGAFVEHRESVSFGANRQALIAENLPKLERMYPEYTPLIMGFEAVDPLRTARWAIDAARLRAARAAGAGFVLIVHNWLGGGTKRALDDIGRAVGYGGRAELHLRNTRDGAVELDCEALRLRATFLDGDGRDLSWVLDAAGIDLVVIHQLLGFGPGIVEALGRWSRHRRAVAYIHDFYPACPRVTLLNAVDSYCGVQPAEVCERCVAMGGAHEASRLTALTVAEHRALFGRVLGNMHAVVAPSADAARHVRRAFPTLDVRAVPHPEVPVPSAAPDRPRDGHSVALLGGIGPHKGADKLLELARVAALSHPALHFHVIGHTSQDDALEKLPNVSITGKYEPEELPALVTASRAAVALFLHVWPETYSYTLSEAAAAGLLPVVPDIGAPAERVRDTGWGRVFAFPMVSAELLSILDEIGRSPLAAAPPLDRFDTANSIPVLRDLFDVPDPAAPSADDAAVPPADPAAAPAPTIERIEGQISAFNRFRPLSLSRAVAPAAARPEQEPPFETDA